ncbi:MAG: phage scaffolding protein [Clostridia bacterium]|nr:phage scaffolding protein [Clostridia bacterium]
MKTLKALLAELGAGEELINSCTDCELYFKDELSQLKEDYENKLAQSEIDKIVETTLVSFGAKNNLAVKALLNLENAQLENGTVKGLNEQLGKIKAENGYLFKSEQSITAGSHNSFSSNDFDGMSDEQYYSIKYGKEN